MCVGGVKQTSRWRRVCRRKLIESLFTDLCKCSIKFDTDESPTISEGGNACASRPCEWIEHHIPWPRTSTDASLYQCHWFLSGMLPKA